MNGLVNMIVRLGMARLVGKAIGKGIDVAAKRSAGTAAGQAANRKKMQQSVKLARMAQRAVRAARR